MPTSVRTTWNKIHDLEQLTVGEAGEPNMPFRANLCRGESVMQFCDAIPSEAVSPIDIA